MKNKTIEDLLNNKTILIIQHESDEGGPGKVLIDYCLRHKAKKILHIAHPNLYIKSGFGKTSRIDTYTEGKRTGSKFAYKWVLPEWALYIKDVIYTLYWGLSSPHKIDIFIGLGNINAFSGLILRLFGKVDTVVYYVIDYIPHRFNNPILNTIYHVIEREAALHSNSTWNLSANIIIGRQVRWRRTFPNQEVVPHGLYYDPKKILPIQKINAHSLVYMGYLNEEQGIQLVIESIPFIAKSIKDIHFIIVGTGNYENELKRLVATLKLENKVTFTGLVRDVEDMEKILSTNAIGVAMYKPQHTFSFFADPGKIKHYLSVGLPIIMTDGPPVASEVREKKCGVVTEYTSIAFTNVVIELLKNKNKYLTLRGNAMALARHYNWDDVLTRVFERILSKNIRM